MSSDTAGSESGHNPPPAPTWTYPTRFCRICREDVAPTVSMYPPGVPPRFQRPVVEYKNDDEYGRLIKPCKCTGSMRYIHELCLMRSRTENRRAGSMWRCHTCGYNFNFQKLAAERFLSSRYSSTVLTVAFMLVLIFVLGFVADPIINLYVDPYDTILGELDIWDEVEVQTPDVLVSWWAQHFVKGVVSMGLVGFLKTMLLNPWNWLNLRHYLGMSGTRSGTTGRDRAVNTSWIFIVIGIISAFYFFYQWVQTIIQVSLKKFGHNIVDTQLPGDDDDLQPPPGWKPEDEPSTEPITPDGSQTQNDAGGAESQGSKTADSTTQLNVDVQQSSVENSEASETHDLNSSTESDSSGIIVDAWPQGSVEGGRSSGLDSAQSQSWSFASI